MKQIRRTRIVLSAISANLCEQPEIFALINLGLVESLASGSLTPTQAVKRFYHADNCLYVKKVLRQREANAIMSHGVQLPDLFESLPPEEAQREFYHELETIRSLCLKLFDRRRSPNAATHTIA